MRRVGRFFKTPLDQRSVCSPRCTVQNFHWVHSLYPTDHISRPPSVAFPPRDLARSRLAALSPHIAAAPASDRAAHLGHLPRTARPRASSLARAESGRARGAPDARGGPTAAHDIKGTPTIFPSHRTLRAHTYRPVGGGDRGDRLGSRLVVWAYTLLWCCSQVKSIHKQQTTIRKPIDLT